MYRYDENISNSGDRKSLEMARRPKLREPTTKEVIEFLKIPDVTIWRSVTY